MALYLHRDYMVSDDIPTNNMFFHDPNSSIRVDFAIGYFRLIANDYFNDWLDFAHADAAGLRNDNIIQIVIFNRIEDGFHRIARAGGNSTSTHANDHLGLPRGSFYAAFFKCLFTQFL